MSGPWAKPEGTALFVFLIWPKINFVTKMRELEVDRDGMNVEGPTWLNLIFLDFSDSSGVRCQIWPPGGRVYLVTETQKWPLTELG